MICQLINRNATGIKRRCLVAALAVIVWLTGVPLDRLYGQDHRLRVAR
jgi:hypothetical protein